MNRSFDMCSIPIMKKRPPFLDLMVLWALVIAAAATTANDEAACGPAMAFEELSNAESVAAQQPRWREVRTCPDSHHGLPRARSPGWIFLFWLFRLYKHHQRVIRACVRVCASACVCVCVRVCVCACVCVCDLLGIFLPFRNFAAAAPVARLRGGGARPRS